MNDPSSANSPTQLPVRLPLVTNYPPYRHWMPSAVGRLFESKPLNIYIHIPFCVQACAFCYYKTVLLQEDARTARYTEAVCREMQIAAQTFSLRRPVASVYIGGGTPTVLSNDQLVGLLACVRQLFDCTHAEITVEADPLTLTANKAKTLLDAGVTRLSVGIQSLDDGVLKMSGRRHNRQQALRSVVIAREAGPWQVNIDLLSGLPGETDETWAETLAAIVGTEVASITIYKLETYANTQFYDIAVRKHTALLPSPEYELRLMRYALSTLETHTYVPWSTFTFTKDGPHRLAYTANIWSGQDLYGFGVSAFGRLGDVLFQNTNDMEQYHERVREDHLPVARAYVMSSLDHMIRDVLLGLKLLRVDLGLFRKKHGFALGNICGPVLGELQEQGLISQSDGALALTREGLLYGDYAGSVLADYLKRFGTGCL